MIDLSALRVKIFADGADLSSIAQLAARPYIRGFTTNPTLMRKSNVQDYRRFALEVLRLVPDRPVSFEVFSDDFTEMERQAYEIASWGPNVNVKIPVTNTQEEFAGPLISRLSSMGVAVNVTAVMTVDQVTAIAACLSEQTKSFVSVFAGRIADTGRDPIPFLARALEILRGRPESELIWASPREVLNILQAHDLGCHIITVTADLLAKLPLLGKDLTAFSLETVRMFREDAVKAGFAIEVAQPDAVR